MLAKLFRKTRKAIVFVTIYAFLLATLPAYAYLPPISNAQMYTLATQGNVPALRAAVQRGLNIDTLDRYGNTALCHAILQRNYTAYNALRAAGANPYHPCVRNLRNGYYDSFLSSKRVVPTTANSREAYAYMGEDDSWFSAAAWWTLGGILLGGALILIFSGGGGGDSGYYFPQYKSTDYSLGALAGTNRPDYPADFPYDPVILLEQNGGTLTNGSGPDYNLGGDNPDGWVIANDASIKVDGESKLLTDLIDFNNSALEYGDYIQAAMKGIYGSTVNNGYAADNPRYDPNKDYLITLGNNATALVALENSEANNYSKINIKAENGTIGMIASQDSIATNDINGQININYIGSKDNHGVIGMYADTNSTIVNNGLIMGQDHSSEPSAGTITGMRGQLINQELAPFSKTYVKNNGRIELDIAVDNREVKTSLVGMGSWLEDEFLNGTMLLSRAGTIYLDNLGSILINVALSGSGTYNAVSEDGTSYLMQGIGGIIGMRSDGNTVATNSALIDIKITDTGDAENTVAGNAAGMQSVHGGTITNENTINVTGGTGNFGMLAVRGEGTNSEFNNDAHEPRLNNYGTINVDSEGGFGMASFNGGGSVNTGTINLAKQGTGIQHDTGMIANSGKINLEQGGVGIAMTQQGDITNELNGAIYIDNALANTDTTEGTEGDGSETAEKKESIGILQQNGTVINDGTITLVNTTGAENTISYGIKSMQGNVTSSNTITISDANDSYAISAQKGNITNSGGIVINNSDGALDGIGYGLLTGTGNIDNSGTISIANKNEAYAISTTNGNITNSAALNISGHKGTISKTAYGIKSAKGSVNNQGNINITDTKDSYGISAENGNIVNDGNITLDNTSGALEGIGYGIQGGGYIPPSSSSSGGDESSGNGASDITNTGNITISDKNQAYAIATANGDVVNSGELTLNGSQGALSELGYGIAVGNGSVNNSAEITIANTNNSYAIAIENGDITNTANLTISGRKGNISSMAYGLKSAKGTVNNKGNITITDTKDSYGIAAENGNITNEGNITLDNTSGALEGIGYGIQGGGYVPPSSSSSGGEGSSSGGESSSSGGASTGSSSSGASNVTNTGTITISDKNQAYAIATANGDVINSGVITLNGAQGALSELGYGIAVGNGSVNNSAEITITNTKDSYAIAVENGDITNTGEINLYNKTGALEGIGYGLKTGRGDITSNADITISNKNEAYAIATDYGNIDSNNAIVINNNTGANGSIAYGIKGGNGYINSNNTITINNANEGYGIYTSNGQVTNNADITLTNSQQAQNKTSYGIKADAGSVVNNADIYMNVTGDTTGEVSNDSGSFGIWGGEANIVNSDNSNIVFTQRGNGMHTESGSNDNYGTIHMQDGGTGMSTASGNATNHKNATITIDDTGVGMKSGKGNAINDGTINITGTLSTGMESERYAVNNNIINVTGYNSKGMSVVTENAQIVNNGQILLNSDHNGLLNYGMYGEKGIYSRMVNNKDILITGREYPSTENIAYGMYLDEGEAKNYGNITLNKMFGYGMYLVTGGTLDNYGNIALNYGGVGMGAGGTPESPATSAMINHEDGVITANGQFSYGMKGEGTATAWNDGSIEITGDDSYGIFTTNGSGTNTSSIVMNSSNNTGMHSVAADTINKSTGVITINGENSVGMSTQDGGTSDTSKVGASNEGIINLEASATSSTGMTVLGSGVATNNNQINVKSTNSSGMWAQGESGTVTNAGTITVTGNESSGMKSTAGTATNNKEIIIQSDDSYGMYANGDTAKIVNGMNGTITIDDANDSKYAMYVKNGEGVNEGTLTFSKQGLVAMYVEKGSIENNRTINLSGDNSVAMQGAGENNATLTNVAGKDGPLDYEDLPDFSTDLGIIVSGSNSTGMKAGGNTTATNDINGVITVNGPNSYGMVATGVTLGGETIYGTAINNGLIIVNEASSQALYADGGIVQNGTSGMIYTNGSIAINVSSGTGTNLGIIRNDNGNFTAMYAEGGTIDNQGRITLNGDASVGMEVNGSATATNSLKTSRIEVNGANSIGMQAKKGTASNSGVINVNGGTGSVAMQADGGTITNESTGALSSSVENGVLMLVNQGDGINKGKISLDTMGITAMRALAGSITNNSGATIALIGNNAVGMDAAGGTAQNNGNISIDGDGGKAMSSSNAGKATNNGQIDVTNANAYALYTNGGTIINTSAGVINTDGSSAMYVAQGDAYNEGKIENSNQNFHAIHVVNGTGTNTGLISLSGEGASGIYIQSGTAANSGGTITMTGTGDTYGINGLDGTGSVIITNSGKIDVSSGMGIANNSGSVTNKKVGRIIVNGVGIYTVNGSATNEGTIEASDSGAIGMQSTGSGGLNNSIGNITVDGTSSIGMSAQGGSIINDSTISVTGQQSIGLFNDGGTVSNGNAASLSVEGKDAVGIQVVNGGKATNQGNLMVQGKYGMFANNGSSVTNTVSGTITLRNGEYAMYATGNSQATNEGIIILQGGGAWGYCDASSVCVNTGKVETPTATMSLFSAGRMLVGNGGNFTAANIEGDLGIDATTIDGNEAVFKNAVTTANASNLNVYGSAWFNDVSLVESEDEVEKAATDSASENDAEAQPVAKLAARPMMLSMTAPMSMSLTESTLQEDSINSSIQPETVDNNTVDTGTVDTGTVDTSVSEDKQQMTNYDIVVKKGRLSNILANNVGIEDSSVLDKLDNAYEAGAQSQVFDAMKSAYTNDELNSTIKKELGLDFFANFAKQNLDVIKSADRQINTAIFNNRSDKEVRFMTGYDFMSRSQKATAYLADYEDQAHSIFGMLDRKFNDHFRYGVGAIMSSLNSEYDSDASSRDEVMFQILFPLTAQFENTKIVSVPRIGMGFGEYTRRTFSGKYEADTTNYYYGITNEARHNIDMGWFGLEPTLEFNVLGIRQNKIKENGALEVDASDSLSVEAGAGLYATKLFEFGEKHTLKLRAGGTIYHELADPYKAQTARLRDAGINYNINSYDADRTRGILSLRVDYNYNKFNFYSEFNKYIESDDAYAINAGMGYKF